jgi:TonB family protein
MSHSTSRRHTLLDIPLVEERYGISFLGSLVFHAGIVVFIVCAPYLFRPSVIQLGSGPGGGTGGESYAVGVIDELSGGAGMTKPSLVPQPPALPAETQAKEEPKEKAVPLPNTVEAKKPKAQATKTTKEAAPVTNSNVIPTAPQPGAGGTGGLTGGSGGGRGGGNGVSIGSGSGGVGDSWYARVVEARISSNWIRPAQGITMDIVYSFYIAADGKIYDIHKDKSSGNIELDLTAERAIRASTPLAPPPPEFRGRPVQFIAQFAYPPSQ